MTKNKSKNEMKEVLEEWQWIYVNFHHFNLISFVKQASVGISTIGINIPHIKPINYRKIYATILEKEDFSILLNDGSVISFYYIFDKDYKITGQTLMYIPVPNDEDRGTGEEMAFAKFMRIDFDLQGYKEVVHTKVHLHVGIYKTEVRIPIANFLYPRDFLFLILKYIYHDDKPFVEKLLQERKRENLLTDLENEMFRIVLGKETKD